MDTTTLTTPDDQDCRQDRHDVRYGSIRTSFVRMRDTLAAGVNSIPSTCFLYTRTDLRRRRQADAILEPPNKFVFEIQHAEALNHLVVFMTGAAPLPDGYGASVHFFFPTKGQWQVLGMITPLKPSAIFRLRGTAVPSPNSTFGSSFSPPGAEAGLTAKLGIFVAPQAEIDQHCSSLSTPNPGASTALVPAGSSSGAPPDPAETVRIARAAGLHIFNYLSSFVQSFPGPNGQAVNVVEFATVEKWWKSFESKCRASGGVGWLINATQGG